MLSPQKQTLSGVFRNSPQQQLGCLTVTTYNTLCLHVSSPQTKKNKNKIDCQRVLVPKFVQNK